MQLALAHNQSVDAAAVWLAANHAGYCQRLSASITAAACSRNQKQSVFDCRCTGCGGLDNQEAITEACPDLVLLRTLDEIIEKLEPGSTLQKHETADEIENIEIDLDEEQLLKLFPELLCQKDDEDHEEVIERRFAEHQEPVKPRMIYIGTCKRCGGYVEDTRERYDDNVFHCLICGWRTGIDYESNRRIQNKGGITV